MGALAKSVSGFFGGNKKKGPSAEQIRAQEQERVEAEKAEDRERAREQATADLQEDERRRRAFRGSVGGNEEEELIGRRSIIGG